MAWVLQLIRGAAVAGVAGSAVMAGALLLGLTEGTSYLVFPLAAIAAVVFFSITEGDRQAQVVGALAVGVAALGLGVATGVGWLEISGMAGAIVAGVLVGSGLQWRWKVPIAAVAALAVVATVVNLVPLILDGGALGHDESAYALKARHWVEGTPETGWNLHRGVAMSGYGFLAFQAGGDEAALRLLGLAAIIGFATATWVLGSRIGGRWVGPLSAVALMSSPVLLRRSTEYLSDVPSSALLVACMIVIWREFSERDIPGYRLLWVLPFAWAAFYIRYQSALSFVLIAVALGVLFWEKVRRGWRPVVLTAVVGLLGLIPHITFAMSETGSPLGILTWTADVAGREFYGEGLVDYFLLMRWLLAAFVGPLAVVFFIWWLVAEWRSRAERIRCLFLMIPAAGQVLALGVVSHGEARFIFFPLALTLIGGITGLTVLMPRWRPTRVRALSFGLAVLLLGSFAMSAAYVRRAVENRPFGTEPVKLAAERVRELSGDDSCGVMTSYLPQITFYSACYTTMFRTYLEPEDALSRLEGEEQFMLMVEDGKRQPVGNDLSGLLDLTIGDLVLVEGERDSVEIYDFAP